jgi:hypothetical protein
MCTDWGNELVEAEIMLAHATLALNFDNTLVQGKSDLVPGTSEKRHLLGVIGMFTLLDHRPTQ